ARVPHPKSRPLRRECALPFTSQPRAFEDSKNGIHKSYARRSRNRYREEHQFTRARNIPLPITIRLVNWHTYLFGTGCLLTQPPAILISLEPRDPRSEE